MIQIKIRELIIFIIVIALFSSLLINCSQHSLIKALEHSIEQRDSLLNESLKFTMFMDVYAYDLDSLSHILGHEFFKYGVQIVWHHGYVSIDLKDIIEYFDFNYKKIA